MSLVDKKCVACEGGVPKLSPEEADFLLEDEGLAWARDGDAILRDLRFKDFRAAIDFVRDVADLAEDEGHHPDLLIHGYRNVQLTLTTHAIGGLSENDFILAAKVDRLHANQYA